MRKKEILPFAKTWMDQQGIMLSEISQTEKDRYCRSHLYVQSKGAELRETEEVGGWGRC